MSDANPEVDQEPTNDPQSTQDPDSEPDSTNPEERTYSAEEYDALKEESIKHRLRAKEADRLREALQAASIREACKGILADPTDLAWTDEFNDDDGMPDVDKIKAAAEQLAESKPHLARVRGDVGQGYRGSESDTVDLASMLKSGA